ncbi:MAG TPA: DUF1080 domain-containing protein [Balneolales bacterium]|jgi:hypothetical protein|nr:DUF1080 domain-containing protein [Balneolales bacterium]
MKQLILITIFMLTLSAINALAQEPPGNKLMKPEDTEYYKPVPKVVTPGKSQADPPSDAIVLFGGKNLDQWVNAKTGAPAGWTVSNGIMTIKPGSGDIRTKQSFGDFQLHIEWRAPYPPKGEGQGRGNSGVYLQSLYELQVLDSYNSKTYVNGQAGSIYKEYPPLVNACRPPGQWQSYDVIFTAPRFNDDGTVKNPARVTAFQNGVLIQNNVKLKGRTLYIGHPYYEKHGPMPLLLQDHHNPVSYRNIWIRPLSD